MWFEGTDTFSPVVRAHSQQQQQQQQQKGRREDFLGSSEAGNYQQHSMYSGFEDIFGSTQVPQGTGFDELALPDGHVTDFQQQQQQQQQRSCQNPYNQQSLRLPKGYDEMIMTGISPVDHAKDRNGMRRMGLSFDGHVTGEVTRRMGDVRLSHSFDDARGMDSPYGSHEYFSPRQMQSMENYHHMMPSFIPAQPQQHLPFPHMGMHMSLPPRMQGMQGMMGYDKGSHFFGGSQGMMMGMKFEGMQQTDMSPHFFGDGRNLMMGMKYESVQQTAKHNKYCHFCQHIKVRPDAVCAFHVLWNGDPKKGRYHTLRSHIGSLRRVNVLYGADR
jgi:hypothetical protein